MSIVHDEVQYEPLPDESAVDFLARVRAIEAQHVDQVERERPVRVTHIFSTNRDPGLWLNSARQISALYKEAFGDERAVELYRLMTDEDEMHASFDTRLNDVGPDADGPDADGEPVSPFWRMLKELRGLRFIVNAEEVKTKNGASYSKHTWVRSRD